MQRLLYVSYFPAGPLQMKNTSVLVDPSAQQGQAPLRPVSCIQGDTTIPPVDISSGLCCNQITASTYVDAGSRDTPTLQERCIFLLVTILSVGTNHNVKKAVYNPCGSMKSTNHGE